MARLTLNNNFINRKDGWGFLLIDSKRNKYQFKYSHGFIKLPDEVAKDFVNDKRVIIEFDNQINKNTVVVEPESPKDNISNLKQLIKDAQSNPVKPEEKPEVKVKPKLDVKKLRAELKELNRAEQMEKLKGYGLYTKELNRLKYGLEQGRIDKLVELMTK